MSYSTKRQLRLFVLLLLTGSCWLIPVEQKVLKNPHEPQLHWEWYWLPFEWTGRMAASKHSFQFVCIHSTWHIAVGTQIHLHCRWVVSQFSFLGSRQILRLEAGSWYEWVSLVVISSMDTRVVWGRNMYSCTQAWYGFLKDCCLNLTKIEEILKSYLYF